MKTKFIMILVVLFALGAVGFVIGFIVPSNELIEPVDPATCDHENTVVYKAAKESTSCVNVGNTEGLACRDCGTIIVTAETLPGLAHTYGEWQGNTATCTAGGKEYRVCTVCTRKETRETTALGHDEISHAAQAYTCTKIGWNAYETCSRCDYTTYEELPAAHSPTTAVIENRVESVCSQIGSYDSVVYCSGCSVELSRETHALAAVAHTPSEVQVYDEVAATCTTDGGYGELVYCTVCNCTISDEKFILEAFGHDFERTIVVEPTCTAKGTADLVCKTCAFEQTWTIPANGHTYADLSSICEVCGVNVSDGLTYSLSSDGSYYTITGYDSEIFVGGAVCIPPAINGIPVKKIGAGAFRSNLDITSVDIPSSVEEIGYDAFNGCKLLQNVTLSEGIKTIGAYAFWNCRLSGTLYIPGSVRNIGLKAFGGLATINRVVIRSSSANYCRIAADAFVCDTITEIYVPWGRWFAGDLNDHAPWGAKNAEIVYGSLIDW